MAVTVAPVPPESVDRATRDAMARAMRSAGKSAPRQHPPTTYDGPTVPCKAPKPHPYASPEAANGTYYRVAGYKSPICERDASLATQLYEAAREHYARVRDERHSGPTVSLDGFTCRTRHAQPGTYTAAAAHKIDKKTGKCLTCPSFPKLDPLPVPEPKRAAPSVAPAPVRATRSARKRAQVPTVAPAVSPDPVVSSEGPSSGRRTCPIAGCGRSFRAKGAGLDWHLANFKH